MAQIYFTLFFACVLCFAPACQRKSKPAPAAAPSAMQAVAPMGSQTTNVAFAKRVKLLEDLMDGKIAKNQTDPAQKPIFDAIDIKALDNIPVAQGLSRDILLAQLHFHEHRFIDASLLLSRILDKNAVFPRARNLLARCFFFLGNPDRAVQELAFVLLNQSKDPEEFLDALFLLGAAVHESASYSPKNLKKAIYAWDTYLKVVPESPYKDKVVAGLAQMREALRSPKSVGFQSKALALKAFAAKDFKAAETTLNRAKKELPHDPEITTTLARIYLQTGRANEALAEFDQITKLHPGYMPGWHYKGMAHILTGHPELAVAAWEQVMERDRGYASRFQLQSRIASAKKMQNN